MPAKWSNRFELKPGRWVYVPTADARSSGIAIKHSIEAKWAVPDYYYHLQRGGHVAAIRSHLGNSWFLRADIQNFFGSINRTRVTRCLKPMFGYKVAREYAVASTVQHPGEKGKPSLPYGFIQSQLLASICLHESALGRFLRKIQGKAGTSVSVYVDDIIASTPDPEHLDAIYAGLGAAAKRAELVLNPQKGLPPARQISAFNILLSEAAMSIEPARLAKFAEDLAAGASASQKRGIFGYVASVCPAQLSAL
jgi:hypothetical protein